MSDDNAFRHNQMYTGSFLSNISHTYTALQGKDNKAYEFSMSVCGPFLGGIVPSQSPECPGFWHANH